MTHTSGGQAAISGSGERAQAMRNIFLGLLASLQLAGCATVTEEKIALGSGRFDKLLSLYEARAPGLDALHSEDLATYCFAAYGGKYYDKVENCINEIEQRFQARPLGPREVVYYRSTELFLRANYALDLGDYNQAVEHAGRLLALTVAERRKPVGYVLIGEPDSIAILALAQALSGNTSAAREHIAKLEALPTGAFTGGSGLEKQLVLARAYTALGDFQRSYHVMQGDPESFARAYVAFFAMIGGSRTGFDPGSMYDAFIVPQQFVRHKSELETGRLEQARAGFDKMLSTPAARANGDIYWLLLHDRGRIAEREGQLDEAVRFYAQAVDVIESQRSTLNSETGRIGFVGSRQHVYRDLIRILMIQGKIGPAFDYVERSKARALIDMLAGKKDFGVADGNAERVGELLAKADSAEIASRALDSTGSPGNKRDLAVQARRELARQAPELSSLVSVSTLSASGVQQALPGDETLVEYFYSGENLYVFVVTRNTISGIRLDAAGLDDEVRAFRRALQDRNSQEWKATSVTMYRRLIAPIRDELRTANLTVVAHGSLHYLPFTALHDGKQFLIEGHAVRMLPAATMLKFLKPPRKNQPGTLLAFANPDLGNARYDLKFAHAEAQAITKAVPKSRALLRKDASKTAFRKYASGFRMLHVASRGEFDADRPLASSLLLSPDGSDDGRLTVGELYSMRVEADLVTLSACETGVGKTASGNDVVGLTRGFLYAGTSTIVASLWQVEDRATGDLMTSFYRALAKGSGKRVALRAAQINFLKTQPHPFYWAAFQLTGTP